MDDPQRDDAYVDRIADDLETTVMVVGDSKSGKTALVASLNQAALRRPPDNLNVTVIGLDDQTRAFFDEVSRARRSGRLVAKNTLDFIEYTFELRVASVDQSFGDAPLVQRFRLVDGQGEFFAGGHRDRTNTDVVALEERTARFRELLSRCQGLIVCVDSTDVEAAERLFEHLNLLFMEIRKPRITRIVVCLTKYDKALVADATDAVSRFRDWPSGPIPPEDASLLNDRFLGGCGLRVLRGHFPDASIGLVRTSAYGFLEHTGSSNYLEEDDRLSSPNEWTPESVLDPFVYFLTGAAPELRVREFARPTTGGDRAPERKTVVARKRRSARLVASALLLCLMVATPLGWLLWHRLTPDGRPFDPDQVRVVLGAVSLSPGSGRPGDEIRVNIQVEVEGLPPGTYLRFTEEMRMERSPGTWQTVRLLGMPLGALTNGFHVSDKSIVVDPSLVPGAYRVSYIVHAGDAEQQSLPGARQESLTTVLVDGPPPPPPPLPRVKSAVELAGPRKR